MNKLAVALVVSKVEKRGVIIEEKNSPEFVYVLLSGVARITCRNRKGLRTLLMIVAPGLIPGFSPKVIGIKYDYAKRSPIAKSEPWSCKNLLK